MNRYLVTGGLGFIGSHFVRQVLREGNRVLNVDLETYAGDERRLADVADDHMLVRADVTDEAVAELMRGQEPDVVVHFAAETHVTRSESDAERFFHANVEGTRRMLEAAERADVGLFVHVSTDEVYGPCYGEPFKEDDKQPGEGLATSAYAKSKALADDLALAYAERVPVIVVRPTNCFGPWQHPEKAIPRWTTRALRGERLPVWGDGQQVRDWMYVEDACDGIRVLIERGETGEVYNLAPEAAQRTNLEIAQAVARAAGRDEDAVYLTAYDRPDHDRRYAVDATKVRALGWNPRLDFETRLRQTVEWYRDNTGWWESLIPEAERIYDDELERQPR